MPFYFFFNFKIFLLKINIEEINSAPKKTEAGKARVTKLNFDKAKIESNPLKAFMLHKDIVSECGSTQDFLIVPSPANEYTMINSIVEIVGDFVKSQIGIVSKVIKRKTISINFIFLSFSFIKLKIKTVTQSNETKRVGNAPLLAPADNCNKNKIKTIRDQRPQVKTWGFVFPFKISLI